MAAGESGKVGHHVRPPALVQSITEYGSVTIRPLMVTALPAPPLTVQNRNPLSVKWKFITIQSIVIMVIVVIVVIITNAL